MAKRRASSPPAVEVVDIGALKPDEKNRRQRTQRSARMIAASMEEFGPARSIVIDENNELIAGSGVLAAAAEAGVTKVQVIDGDGKTLYAVRRRGLSPEQKRALAIYDNRTAELSEWNPEQLRDDQQHGRPLAAWFTDGELRKELRDLTDREAKVKELATGDVADRFWISVRGPLKAQASALQRLREMLKDIPDLEVDLGLSAVPEAWGE